ncbi:Clp protease N-terminal domain-containing protein [Catellatospora sp. KI3]|uniref:Clp protease N-terminal domain-containing protein n=1 Tax=Catellatospora sp. KI3 TaxID=3041620 RepID=UPI002482D291|nr:Clp protease N-terminal domain-containing protein [Catellatospora sp. KI3]MDI1461222.1 Clp protease N-terminal domain-containing protein [Catellatospora sp. KI3]
MADTPRLDDLITVIKQRHPDGDPLSQLSDAVLLGQHLGELADHLIGHFVDRARHSGASWTDIGQSMGVTKQAAQKRFVPKEGGESDLRVFARYDDAARQTLVQAQEVARLAGHEHLGPEHVLLGLLSVPGTPAIAAITDAGTTPQAVQAMLAARFPSTGRESTGPVPFSGAGKKALELGHRESLRLGHEHIGAEHLLLGVLAMDEGEAVSLLHESGLSSPQTEAVVRRESAA